MAADFARRTRALARGQRGQALVETAIAFPLLLIAALGLVQFALFYHAQNVVTGAVQEGARVAAAEELPEQVVLMELDMQALLSGAREPHYADIPRFPAVQIDLAVVVPEEVTCRRVGEVIWREGQPLLRGVRLFDLYRGGQVEKGCKSLAFSLTFYALDRTLKDEEVMELRAGIVKSLEEELGARLR